jgi:hypothetical protein
MRSANWLPVMLGDWCRDDDDDAIQPLDVETAPHVGQGSLKWERRRSVKCREPSKP